MRRSGKTQDKGSHTSFLVWAAKPLTRIYKDTVPKAEDLGKPLEISCAQNEFEGCMFGIRANTPLHRVRLKVSDLSSREGTIPKANLRLQFVGTVPVPRNTPATPFEELERMAPYNVPDPILDVDHVDVAADVTQPCHFLVHVPRTKPGDYHGAITVSSKEGEASLPIVVNVYPIVLPSRRSLFVTNWFDLNRIASVHNVELWSEEFWKAFEKWVAFMAEYRQNVFWVSLDTVKVFAGSGGYRFDFSMFDRYVEILMKYKASRIEIMHVAGFKKWGGAELILKDFRVTDPSGDVRTENGSKILPFLLPALARHLDKKGWLEKSLIHVADEPTEDGIKAWTEVSKLVHKYAPGIPRMDAIETIGFEEILEVWIPTLQHFDNWIDHYLKAMEDGYELWFYTCLNPKGRYPNRFLDYSLLKTRILHWINYAYGFKGYLHWGFNWWQEKNPFGEPPPNLPPGDSHISYPGRDGPLPSLRLEAFRDGLEDYEYLKLLEDETNKVKKQLGNQATLLSSNRRAMETCKRIVPSLTGYAREPEALMKVREALVEEVIELRRRPLALVWTEPPEWKPVVKGAVTIIVRGVCEEGSNVEVNDKQPRVLDGYFATYTYPKEEGDVVVRIVKDGLSFFK